MKLIFENEDVRAYYKEKGENTLSSSDYTKDDSLFIYRLDRATSGILIKAKSETIYDKLKEMQKKDEIKKVYIAKTTYNKSTEFYDEEIAEYVKRSITKNKIFKISSYFRPYKEGRKSVKVVNAEDKFRLKNKDVTKNLYTSTILSYNEGVFRVSITKGFRHQIRSHLAASGYPIVGDTLYGGINIDEKSPYQNGIALECVRVSLKGLCVVDIENLQLP